MANFQLFFSVQGTGGSPTGPDPENRGGDQDGILLIECLSKGQTNNAECYSSLLVWCNWRTFWRNNAAGRSPRGSCSCTTMPRLKGHLQPRRNWPTWASDVLITHPILRIWPRRTTTCSLDWKAIEMLPFFVRRGDLVGQKIFWTFLFCGLQKLEQRAKKCTELRGEYVEKIPSLVAAACFLPGRAKDLSAPPRVAITEIRNLTLFWRTTFNYTVSLRRHSYHERKMIVGHSGLSGTMAFCKTGL